MKRIIIITMMFLSTYCSLESCIDETDISQCTRHTMEAEFNYLSCFKFKDNTNSQCAPNFIDHGSQKVFAKFLTGSEKELKSMIPSEIHEDETIRVFDKETYDKDDTISTKSIQLTEEDKRIINNKNTCNYNAKSKSVKFVQYPENTTIKVADKNVCFNSERFEDLKDILDCGYATLKGKYMNVPFIFTCCCSITDENADEKFKRIYKDFYLKQSFQSLYNEAIKKGVTDFNLTIEERGISKKRQLQTQEIKDFEMFIEDKHGNIIRFNQNGDIIDGDNEPNKFVNSCGKNSLDFILLLCFILLFS